MRVLGIETSCDETSASVASDATSILSCVVASSLAEHEPFGGIIPEIASRAQLESLSGVVAEALREAHVNKEDLDAVAVTQGPGLIGSLLVGISFARALSVALGVPLVGINHLQAHLYAAFIDQPISFPFIGLVVSGGHTSLYRVTGLGREEGIGSTRDDAAGEAFDKVAKILGLGYPGGPVIEERARGRDAQAFAFRCDGRSDSDFSFSGIKTAVLYKAREVEKIYGKLSKGMTGDLAASFQATVIEDLVHKSFKACRRYQCGSLAVGGGVAFNNALRARLQEEAKRQNVRLCIAAKPYCLDNAAMVASLAARLIKGKKVKKRLHMDSLFG